MIVCLVFAAMCLPLVPMMWWTFAQEWGNGPIGAAVAGVAVVFWLALGLAAWILWRRWAGEPAQRREILTVGPEGVVLAAHVRIPFGEMTGLRIASSSARPSRPALSVGARIADAGITSALESTGNTEQLQVVMQVPTTRVQPLQQMQRDAPAAQGVVSIHDLPEGPGAPVDITVTLSPWLHEGDFGALRSALTSYAGAAGVPKLDG
jgi:hypothetical protein